MYEESEDTKGVIRICNSKYRQQKKGKMTNNDLQKTKDGAKHKSH